VTTVQAPVGVASFALDEAERSAVEDLLAALASAESEGFLGEARRLAYSHLPVRLVRFLEAFRLGESASAVLLEGLEVDDERIGPTPSTWGAQVDPSSTLREELYLLLAGSILGEVFGWATLQGGRLVHNVMPVSGKESDQSGHGSTATLAWHTEDGFHPYRCDYLGLMGLRNDACVPTTFASIDAVALSPAQRRVLSQPRFVIRPDEEHLTQAFADGAPQALPADWHRPQAVSVLFGGSDGPYLRIDPYFMSTLDGDAEAEDALGDLVQQLDAALEDMVLEPGVVCFVDNYRAVHGRQAFAPAYDERDRWLKKIVVTRDLRKSRAVREGPSARVLQPAPLAPAEAEVA
jgi:L-asparagine oxygenase